MMEEFNIDQLFGEAYNNAIDNVAYCLNKVMGTEFFRYRDWYQIHDLCLSLGITFDENGKIIK